MVNQLISANNTTVDLTHGIKIGMSSMEISPIAINNIKLNNFKSNFSYRSGNLINAQMEIAVTVNLAWWVGISVKIFGKKFSVSKSGNITLISYNSGFISLGNLQVSPGNMNIDIPSLTLKFQSDDLKIPPATSDPATTITADTMDLNKMKIAEAVIPGSLPALFGGGMIPVQNPLGAMNMSMCDTKIDAFSTLGIKIPAFELSNLQMTNISIPQVTSDAFSATATKNENFGTIDLGILTLTPSLTVTTTMKVDQMEFDNLNGSVTADKAEISSMEINLNIGDINIKNIEINKFNTQQIDIGL